MSPYFAATESGNILSALGIDWQMLVFQIIGFLVLVWLMAKFVYPPMLKTIDERKEKIDAGAKAADEAEKKANEAKEDVAKMLKQARAEASDIVATAKEESNSTIREAEIKAKEHADHIVESAHEQIDKDIVEARKILRNDTIELVALATEKVIGKTVSSKVDRDVISSSVKEVR